MIKSMSPNELFKNGPVEYITDNIDVLWGCYYSHIPEIQNPKWTSQDFSIQDKIKIIVHKEFDFDGRRFWRLASVTFDDIFVMVIQNAGREGDDWAERFIVNPDAYTAMLFYIQSLIGVGVDEEKLKEDTIDPDSTSKNLLDFYGNNLYGYFEKY